MASRLKLKQTKSAPAILGLEGDHVSRTKIKGHSLISHFWYPGIKKDLNNTLKHWNLNWRHMHLIFKAFMIIYGISITWATITFYTSPVNERENWNLPNAPMSPFELNVDETPGMSISFSHGLRGLKIPIPVPTQKASVVLMNYSRPRMIQESSLMRTLLSHPNVGEILLLHANPKTRFEFVHEKVVNVDATQENDEMGLSLRFYFSQMAKHEWVIHVDDDMEFDENVLNELLIEFNKNTNRIVGRFGRNLNEGGWFNGYSSSNTHKQTDVVLTKLMIMERDLCTSFFEYAHLIWEDIVLNQGEGPMWNGEDIFMSLVANHVYGGKGNYAMDWLDVRSAPNSLKDYENGKLDISGGYSGYRFWSWEWWQSLLRRNRHYSYRGMLWRAAESRLAMLSADGNSVNMKGLLTPE